MSESGYKNPPKHSRFQKGCSGNPAGRPKGSKNTLKLLDAVLEQKIKIQQEGKTISITKKQAMLMQLVNAAVKGEIKAIAALFPYMMLPPADEISQCFSVGYQNVRVVICGIFVLEMLQKLSVRKL